MSQICNACDIDLSKSSEHGKNFARYTLMKMTTPVTGSNTAKAVFPNLRSVNGFCLWRMHEEH